MINAHLPIGTVTFVFTDIEGSTRLLQALGARYGELLDEHRRMIRAAAAAHGGVDFGSEGDALFLVFQSAAAAVATAVEAQQALAAYPWPADGTIRVRMGVHTGSVVLGVIGGDLRTDYTAAGQTTGVAARLVSLARAGEIVVSDYTRALA